MNFDEHRKRMDAQHQEHLRAMRRLAQMHRKTEALLDKNVVRMAELKEYIDRLARIAGVPPEGEQA